MSCASVGQASTRGKPYEPPTRGLSGTARAARSLLRRRLAGAKRVEAVLKPEAAAALAELRERTGRTYSAIIEGLLLAEHGMRRGSHPR